MFIHLIKIHEYSYLEADNNEANNDNANDANLLSPPNSSSYNNNNNNNNNAQGGGGGGYGSSSSSRFKDSQVNSNLIPGLGAENVNEYDDAANRRKVNIYLFICVSRIK